MITHNSFRSKKERKRKRKKKKKKYFLKDVTKQKTCRVCNITIESQKDNKDTDRKNEPKTERKR